MIHALLRYGDLTARGIAGGRTGLNVDSVATRAATRSDEKIKAIFAVIDSSETACVVGRTSETAEEGHGWLLTQPDALLCCLRGQAHVRDRQDEYRIGEVAR